MIAAIVLAAGESRRMGSPKALLPFPEPDGTETTFVEHVVGVFRQSAARPIVVVLGHDASSLSEKIDLGDARIVTNTHYREGMLSSIHAGIDAVADDDEVEGVLVNPVDHPDIRSDVVDTLVARFESERAPVVLPVFEGRRGHPVLFSRAVFDEVRNAPKELGARRVVWDHQEDLLEIEVRHGGVTTDIDTPGDYRAFRDGT